MFGLAMPYLAERFGFLRSPWNWITIITSLAVVALVATAAIQLLLLNSARISPERFWPEFGYKSGTVFLVALIIAISVWGYEKFRDQIDATNLQLRTQQLEKERALKLLTEARLSALESRLQPHFLFNTLNNISALISENPPLAEEMIQRLATLLRVSLDAHTGRHVALRDEIRLAKDYVEIEKIRLGERLSLTITMPPELERLIVPPMTLQPLIENSIKYSISPRIEGGQIKVSAQQENGRLTLSVWDDGPGFATDQIAAGHSIDNLSARLKDMFGNEAEICVSCESGGAEVKVSLPAKIRRPRITMDKMRAYLVDDESLALDRLAKLLHASGRVDVVGKTTNPRTAVQFLSSAEVDVVFLDIHMPELNGFEILDRLKNQPPVIFTTAYDQYALKAFEVNSIDYLLKPVDSQHLDRALKKLESRRGNGGQAELTDVLRSTIARLTQSLTSDEPGFPNRICSRIGDRVVVIDLERISHFYSEDKLTYASTDTRQYIVDYSLETLEQVLCDKGFVRIHRSTLVNLAFVEELHRWFGGRMIVRIKGGNQIELTVARSYVSLLKQKLGLE